MAEVDPWSDVEIPEPFVRFFRSEYPAVVSLVFGLSGSRAAAEDIAQEAFFRAHREWRGSTRWSPLKAGSGVWP